MNMIIEKGAFFTKFFFAARRDILGYYFALFLQLLGWKGVPDYFAINCKKSAFLAKIIVQFYLL